MKEIGILMQTEMVCATLDDRKTETRRTRGLKEINTDIAAHEKEEEPAEFTWHLECTDIDPDLIARYDRFGEPVLKKGDGFYATFHWTGYGDIWRTIKCPYGKPGDILYVRETWSEPQLHNGFEPDVVFRADGEYGKWGNCGWKPSIHLKKEHSRIWLRVKEIKIERLHEITEQGAKEEGIKQLPNGRWEHYMLSNAFDCPTALISYRTLWFKINGEESWNQNPYVWVVKYEVLSKTGKQII